MLAAAAAAIVIGSFTGLFFSAIALVPVSTLFLIGAIVFWAADDDLTLAKVLAAWLYLIALNVGFLAGVIVRRIHIFRRK